jgi:putative membrane protein insertion efficiency factor
MKYLALGLIYIYRLCVSPLLGNTCRFFPTCSEYAEEAFKRHGFFYGFWLTLKRLVKCHPWHPGGVDEVP